MHSSKEMVRSYSWRETAEVSANRVFVLWI